jgi:AP-5 complex subunit beta-1
MFLPPFYHLLLKFNIGQHITTIKIRTDYWQVLAYVDEFLTSLS